MVNTYSLSHLKTHKTLQKMQTIFYKTRQIIRFTACIMTADLNKIVATHVNSFLLLHLNISSLPYHFEEFDELLTSLHIKFSAIEIIESRPKLNIQPLVNINLKNYNIEETPTESEKGGASPYISSDINYKVRKDLNTYEAKELESTFIEIINKDRKNCIIGCICKHPKM